MSRSKDIKDFLDEVMDEMEEAADERVQEARIDEAVGLIGRMCRKLMSEGLSEESAVRLVEKMLEAGLKAC